MLRWLRDGAVNYGPLLAERARQLRVAAAGTVPDPADVALLRGYASPRDYTGPPWDWYSLLRPIQGCPDLMLRAGIIEDASGFPAHPAARWGYVIDLDAKALEAYQGGQLLRHDRGRFAKAGPTDIAGHRFWPAALVESWPFARLPLDDAFLAACHGPEEGG